MTNMQSSRMFHKNVYTPQIYTCARCKINVNGKTEVKVVYINPLSPKTVQNSIKKTYLRIIVLPMLYGVCSYQLLLASRDAVSRQRVKQFFDANTY